MPGSHENDFPHDFLFEVTSGMLQGCPLKSILFVICIGALLWLFISLIVYHGHGFCTACADDIAVTLRHMHHPNVFYDASTFFKRVSGLTLAPKRCVLILSSVCASVEIAPVKTWLRLRIPEWELSEVSNVGNYLVFHFAPLGGSWVWKGSQPILP